MICSTAKAVRISERVYWVGAIDWNIRDFHGYTTKRGSTYNAYLIKGTKNILVDTVKAPFKDEMLGRIADVIEPGRIDYIISNHAEMDHSGCLPEIIDLVKPEKVFASSMGVRALKDHFGLEGITAVKSGESLSLEDVRIDFLETRMLHWPDSMFTWLPDDRVLFSQDAFGMHLASSERFSDELPAELLEHEAAVYYANILLPYSQQVQKLLDSDAVRALVPEVVVPDHGPVWRQDFPVILENYRKWSRQRPTRKAVVLYDTMWHSTELMAGAVMEGLKAGGARPLMISMGTAHRSDVAAEILEAGALIVGSPTLNNHLLPSMADVLTYLKGLKPQNLMGGVFGSYGWSGESVAQVHDFLVQMKVDMPDEPLKVKYVPEQADLKACFDLGDRVARRLGEVSADGD